MQLIQLKKKYYSQLDHLDMDIILSRALKKTREFVLAHPEYILTENKIFLAEKLLRRRINHEPLAYIIGHKEFYSLDFEVNRHTLIPRPETELIVEKIIQKNPTRACIIDAGTGSGNIIISLAKNIRKKNIFLAVDISKQAARIAKKNARIHRVDKKIKFFTGNLLDPISRDYPTRNQLQKNNISSLFIAANLPYLNKNIYQSAQPEIKKYEPRSALLSGQNGLTHYQKLFSQIKRLEKAKKSLGVPIYIFIEISPEQKNDLKKILASYWKDAKIFFHKDLSRKWRVCECLVLPAKK